MTTSVSEVNLRGPIVGDDRVNPFTPNQVI